jgi:hypothetical protein
VICAANIKIILQKNANTPQLSKIMPITRHLILPIKNRCTKIVLVYQKNITQKDKYIIPTLIYLIVM